MLSKPKYMLPGNLSQGAPILEPDKNGDYNFSFALDGDEEIKEASMSIYTLSGERIANENLSVELKELDYEPISYRLQEKNSDCLEVIVKLKIGKRVGKEYVTYEEPIEFSPLDDIARENYTQMIISFDNYFNGIKDGFLQESEYYDNFKGEYIEAYEPQAGVLPIVVSKSGSDMDKNGDFMILGPLKFFDKFEAEIFCTIKYDEDKEKWKIVIEPTEVELKYCFYLSDFNNFNTEFVNKKDEQYFPFGIYEVNKFIGNDYEKKYPDSMDNPTTNLSFYGYKKIGYRWYSLTGGKFFENSSFKNFPEFYDTFSNYSQNLSVFDYEKRITCSQYPQKFQKANFEISMSTEDKETNFKINTDHLTSKFRPPLEDAGFTDYRDMGTPLFPSKDNYILLMLRVNKSFFNSNSDRKIKLFGNVKTKELESTKFYDAIQTIEAYPKNSNGEYNFLNFKISKEKGEKLFVDKKEYFWKVRAKNKEDKTYESDDQIFKILKPVEKKYEFFQDVVKNIYGVKTNGSFENKDILEYSYEIKDKENRVFYKSPLIKNSNLQFNDLPLYALPENSNYEIYVNAIDVNMKTIKKNSSFPKSKYEGLELNYNYDSLNQKLSFSFASDDLKEYIKSYILYRYDIKNGKYFIVKDGLTQKDGIIEVIDKFNSSEKFQYFISVIWDKYYLSEYEPQYEHSNFSPIFINDEKKWRLILTKEKKSDIIYSVDKVYDFYYNLVSGSIGNNAETTINTNFTSMPSVQKGFSNYWSGSLSALMGIQDEHGAFAQTIEQEKALEQLVLDQEHEKFLLDREGNIWQVEISAPLTIANQDGLVQGDKLIDLKTITIDWVQSGTPTQIVFDFEE